MTLSQARRALRQAASPDKAVLLRRFFRCGPGEYGEGDCFLGVMVPEQRAIARKADGLRFPDVGRLLRSRYHEERLLALLILVRRFQSSEVEGRKRVFDFYLRHRRYVNNWDLVDSSAEHIVGAWLYDKDKTLLSKLARASSLWDRRIAIVSTFYSIRRGKFTQTLRLARLLLDDEHDLMHKATGWMLREVGKRSPTHLRRFLDTHAAHMPRTMLRYAIERFPVSRRRYYLGLKGKT